MEGTFGQVREQSLPGLSRYQRSLEEVFQRARALDLRSFEVASVERVAAELRPAVTAVLESAIALLGAILTACDPRGAESERTDGHVELRNSFLPFERAVDATLAAKRGSHRTVEEVAFIAQLELRQRKDRLAYVRVAQGVTLMLGEADSSLRRVCKALSAVDAAIAEAEGCACLLVFTPQTAESLAVRRAYARLRKRLRVDEPPCEDALQARFRAAGTELAMLIGRPVYAQMRVRDRLLLRELQQRILTWLRGAPCGAASDGLQLWRDLTTFVEMLALVNQRQELKEHDASLISSGLQALRRGGETITDEIWTRLQALTGLDRDFDALLSGPQRPSASCCIRQLERLAALSGEPASSQSDVAGSVS